MRVGNDAVDLAQPLVEAAQRDPVADGDHDIGSGLERADRGDLRLLVAAVPLLLHEAEAQHGVVAAIDVAEALVHPEGEGHAQGTPRLPGDLRIPVEGLQAGARREDRRHPALRDLRRGGAVSGVPGAVGGPGPVGRRIAAKLAEIVEIGLRHPGILDDVHAVGVAEEPVLGQVGGTEEQGLGLVPVQQHQELVVHQLALGAGGADAADPRGADRRLVLRMGAAARDVVEDDLDIRPAASCRAQRLQHRRPLEFIEGAPERPALVLRTGDEAQDAFLQPARQPCIGGRPDRRRLPVLEAPRILLGRDGAAVEQHAVRRPLHRLRPDVQADRITLPQRAGHAIHGHGLVGVVAAGPGRVIRPLEGLERVQQAGELLAGADRGPDRAEGLAALHPDALVLRPVGAAHCKAAQAAPPPCVDVEAQQDDMASGHGLDHHAGMEVANPHGFPLGRASRRRGPLHSGSRMECPGPEPSVSQGTGRRRRRRGKAPAFPPRWAIRQPIFSFRSPRHPSGRCSPPKGGAACRRGNPASGWSARHRSWSGRHWPGAAPPRRSRGCPA